MDNFCVGCGETTDKEKDLCLVCEEDLIKELQFLRM